ncbi:hypothetical protein Enr10x_26610 [Gimesia panareensis]|uniref:DUF4291 domain-containing protein n=1 Tax=Gimesia panareensis TaxID=2527978 RepID=A0A517Q6U7_9PLAN|nr:DUF4291 domain-containing protein [Gimesia panareensis]QDT27344.1 hypothetical protein Enr10x_26610 [Gimesia panareensis]
MASLYEIRADYNRETIVVYQAYAPQIADAALAAQKFVAPFSFGRMTWIKPSFLWLMHRSNWGQKSGQTRILAVRISRAGWERALSQGELTSPEQRVYGSASEWEQKFRAAPVHIQWDTERSSRGAALPCFSIQVGLSRQIIREFVDEWIVGIEDLTPLVRKLNAIRTESSRSLKRSLPVEKIYPLPKELARKLLISR